MLDHSELSILLIEDEPDAAGMIQHVLSGVAGSPMWP